ncbi:DUF1724 domain-containing protein [Methanosalsum natronophilum]|uniref:DUF1724 domain-containing protein n=1 Tax=Methanosalsum natronophilum TaxID=768733 RepID=A0A424Z3B5_9EURY|nr:MAG: DUF1724 domain-containing protein [Methanosalsum natronophilum]
MDSELSDTIWISDKRKRILSLLLTGPKTSNEIKQEFGCSWRPLISPMKKLKEEGLVVQNDDDHVYRLSYIGKALTENMIPLIKIVDLFESDYHYWKSRDFDSIPLNLLTRMGEIGDCEMLDPALDRIFELDEEFVNELCNCQHINAMLPFFHPEYINIFSRLASNGTKLNLIFKDCVLNRLEEEYTDKFEPIKQSEDSNIFVNTSKRQVPGIVVSEKAFLLSLFDKNGNYDHKDVVGYDQRSIRWGNDLFSHFISNSSKV